MVLQATIFFICVDVLHPSQHAGPFLVLLGLTSSK